MVLSILVLATALIVAFLTRVGSERTSSASYSALGRSRVLSDMAVNLVQGQINDATTRGSDKAWVSQPGALRVFSGDGTLESISRLYSAPSMTTNNPDDLANDVPPADWAAQPAQWCDLNAPATALTTGTVFPILDATGTNAVEGFSINSSAAGVTLQQPAPMPVRWLYVLKDGSLVSGTGTGTTVTVAGATSANPITGRIAFWTDDDTCRVNINTASEGTFWDTPRVFTDEDKALAKYQPAQHEFQRYPGHPAMTSLSSVFPSLTKDEIYKIVPRVVGGGSNAGTVVATGTLSADSDRLYSSVGELLFNKDRGQNILTKDQLEKAKFFLTAQSRAPEVNLFSMPRVALWPIDSNTANRTVFDKMIAFCSTSGTQPQLYHFQRNNPKSATEDYYGIPNTTGTTNNQKVYAYLQNLTGRSVPGSGATTFSSKYGADRDQILTEIFDYIRSVNLDDGGLPVKQRFADRAILASGKTGFNNAGFGQVTPIRIGTTQGFGRFPAISEAGIQFICTAKADDPATNGTDESLGSNVAANLTLSGTLLTTGQRRIEALFFFETTIPGEGWPYIWPAVTINVKGLDGFKVNGTSLAFPGNASDLYCENLDNLSGYRAWGGVSSHRAALNLARLPARGVMLADKGITDLNTYPFVSVPITITVPAGKTMDFTGATLTVKVYSRNSDKFPGYDSASEPVQTYTLTFPDGKFPVPDLVTRGVGAASAKENWWTFSRDGCGVNSGTQGRIAFIHQSPGTKANTNNNTTSDIGPGTPFRGWTVQDGDADVVRTLVPVNADIRLIAASPIVSDTTFVPHPNYKTTTTFLAHYMMEGSLSNNFLGPFAKNLVKDISYSTPNIPDVPAYDARSESGDWDNGTARTTDGAYINKPDEGNVYNIATKTPYFDDPWSWGSAGTTFFSPNRQMPSAGMLGSLPTGVKAGEAFRTLLFRPQDGHFGATAPADHLLMDLFWMPVVEPYAISEPFSTAGKINMNCAIVPFSYIKRQTGLYALLKSEKLLAIPKSAGSTYKAGAGAQPWRMTIDRIETLKQFDAVFSSTTGPRVFLSPTQIAELHLVPQGQTVAGMSTFWNNYKLTGDNSRERPYTNLVGRLTTKSNSYTVYFTVQALQNPTSANQGTWDEAKGKILSEYRGSTSLERYIDPADTAVPDYLTTPDSTDTLDKFYRWRIVGTRQFSP